MIRRAVASASLPQTPASGSLEEFLSPEWLCRPRPEPIEGEFRLLAGLDINKHVIVLLFRSLSLPIEVRWIVSGYLDARATGKDRVLFRTATAQHQILYAIYLVDFGGVDMPVQYDHLHVLGIRRDHLVRIVGGRDWAQARPGKHGIVENDKGLANAIGLGFVHPLLELRHLLGIFGPISVPL